MIRNTLFSLMVLAVVAWPGCAHAAPAGVVVSPSELEGTARRRLLGQVQRARREHAAEFEAVAALRAQLPELDRRQRGRLVTAVLPLRALGDAGLMPMLAELAVSAPPRGDLSQRAWDGWRVSLLEATGALADARAEPVLVAILEGSGREPVVLRAAARALGRLGTGRAAAALLRRVRGAEREVALELVPGLGECRRAAVARGLRELLAASAADEALALRLVSALGQVGNAWAWQTPSVARSGEGDATRRVAATALIESYPALGDDARRAAVKALALVSHPGVAALLAAARRTLTGPRAEAVAELAARLGEF